MKRTLLSLALFCSATAWSQQPLVLLDPARGGSESGAHVGDRIEEKTVTLSMAVRLGSLLRARGFAVEMTRDSDTDVTNDQRAALANTSHPIACILLHATGTGTGIHLYTTTLQQTDPFAGPALWDTAQAPYADRSRALVNEIGTAFQRSKLPVFGGQTWIRPLDNMQCPAVAIEVSPAKDGTTADDTSYQTKVLDAVAGALLFWRGKVDALTPKPPPPPEPAASPAVLVPQPVTRPTTPAPQAVKPAAPAVAKPATAPTPRPAATTTPVAKPAVTTAPKPATTAAPKPAATTPAAKPAAPKPAPAGEQP